MERRLLLAVVLSILVMLAYPWVIKQISPPPTEYEKNRQLLEKQEVIEPHIERMGHGAEEKQLPEDAFVTDIKTDRYRLTICNIGGSIQAVKIIDGKRLDIGLVENAIYASGILSMEGEGVLSGLSSQPFEIIEDTNSFFTDINSIRIEKNIRFLKDRYAFNAAIKITNTSDSPQILSYEITVGSNISHKEVYESRYIGADVLYKDGRFKRIASGNFKKPRKVYNSNIEWLALKNKYYSIIARPDWTPSGVFTRSIDNAPVIGFIIDDQKILPGETRYYALLFYIGPTELSELEMVEESFGKALNFGFFTGISLVLLSILKFFYGLFHNYGVAILLLTCCVSLLLFPLSFKSISSMRKLQEVQPHIEKVRQEHKDNPHKLNKEIMEIYRRYKVNPMGGCLPMLFQMPIFIALYQTLMRSVELKGAGFLWIKDLSMPDAAWTLPFSVPLLGNTINLLPILMIGAMIIQQRLSHIGSASTAGTEQQKMMARIMPIVFGFIFYSLPSGLVLYWLTNTILTTSLQSILLRKS